jgi:hypothetical protein
MDFRRLRCYIVFEESDVSHYQKATARAIQELARQQHVKYVGTQSDALAQHITRLAGDQVVLDEIERTLVALHRNGHLSRREMVRLQASYLREARS